MTPPSITQWLQQPHQDIDSDALQQLIGRYPYFAPLQYMAAAGRQVAGQPVALSGNPHLYVGNWVLFYELMQAANGSRALAEPEPASAETQAQETAIATEPAPLTNAYDVAEEASVEEAAAPIIQPVFSEDYFLHQGITVADTIPEELDAAQQQQPEAAPPITETMNTPEDPKSLMVVMSFTEWLLHFRSKTQKEKEEEEDKKAVKHMWQKEKLAAALEEEDDEIPENVFEMAVNSITKEDGLVSESLADILAKQGKLEKAIEMYRKLSLRNPQKSTYFAQQIASIQKKSES